MVRKINNGNNFVKILLVLILLIVIFVASSLLVSAVIMPSSAPNIRSGFVQPSVSGSYGFQGNEPTFQQFYDERNIDYATFWPHLGEEDSSMCHARQDFILEILPGSCSPSVVRSDLLESQNVPVFCQISALKINPLFDINEIRSVSFTEVPSSLNSKTSGGSLEVQKETLKGVTERGIKLKPADLKDADCTILAIKDSDDNVVPLTSYREDECVVYFKGTNSKYNNSEWEISYRVPVGQKKTTTKLPSNIAGISFHPARAAVRPRDNLFGETPTMNNIGYVVVLIKKNKNESSMPESVDAELTAHIKYDIKKVFGSGNVEHYLQVLSDAEWERNYKGYSFFKGKAYLRLDELSLSGDSAKVSLYKDGDTRYNSVNLQKGKESNLIYLPGYYCSVGVRLKLVSSGVPQKKVKLQVDNDVLWVYEGAKFLDDKCVVRDIKSETDEKTNINSTTVAISCPKGRFELKLEENGGNIQDKEFSSEILRDEFHNAKKEAIELAEFYGSETDDVGRSYALKALQQAAELARNLGRSSEAIELYEKIVSKYPETTEAKDAEIQLRDLNKYDYSNARAFTEIDYQTHTILLLDAKTPNVEEASAEFDIDGDGKNEKYIIGDYVLKVDEGGTYLKLTKIEDTSVVLEGKLLNDGKKLVNVKYNLELGKKLIEQNVKLPGNEDVTLLKINLKKEARIQVIPEIPIAGSSANFTFHMGIEERAIQISPEKTLEMIKNLNESIEKWEQITKNLGNLVTNMKKICFTGSLVLIAKNFMNNLGGAASSRNEIMSGVNGWVEQCNREMNSNPGKYNSLDDCLHEHNDEIEAEVDAWDDAQDSARDDLDGYLDSSTYDDNRAGAQQAFIDNKFLPVIISHAGERVNVSGVERKVLGGPTAIFPREEDVKKTSVSDAMTIMTVLGAYPNGIHHEKLKPIFSNIITMRELSTGAGSSASSEGDCKIKYKAPEVKYFATGKNKGLPHIIPLDKTNGWYMGINEGVSNAIYKPSPGGITEAGQLQRFWICNVGPNGVEEFDSSVGDDKGYCFQVNLDTGQPLDETYSRCLDKTESQTLIRKAQRVYRNAGEYSQDKAGTFNLGEVGAVKVSATIASKSGTQCQDFMSADDCHLLFNMCDPVLCPSSRCNLGGTYTVDNVVQSGIFGSLMLCLPNVKEKIYIPVCLTGVYAGLDAYLSILRSNRDCLQKRLETGENIGFCDEITSIYQCEFFWRQVVPFLKAGIPKLLGGLFGGGSRGGGEYNNFAEAWNTADESFGFFTQHYAAEAFKAFNLRNTEEVGETFCKMFIGGRYPNVDLIDRLAEPESPTQFYAEFDEIPFSEASVPPTSQYNVWYHIYAGRNQGVYYSVYLKDPPESSFYAAQPSVIVKQGYIGEGEYADEKIEFTAPKGYKQLCVRINDKDSCGFQKVTTDYGLNYLSGEFAKDQANNADIKTESECVEGSLLSTPSVNFNLQEFAQETIDPAIYKKGIIRVCSANKPGSGEGADAGARWKEVGFCDDQQIKCWLDLESVKDAIENKNLQDKTLEEVNRELGSGIYTSEQARTELSALDALIKKITAINDKNYKLAVDKAEDIETGAPFSVFRANAVYLKFLIYHKATNLIKSGVVGLGVEIITPTGETGEESGGEETTGEAKDVTEKYDIPVSDIGFYNITVIYQRPVIGVNYENKVYVKIYFNKSVDYDKISFVNFKFVDAEDSNTIYSIKRGQETSLRDDGTASFSFSLNDLKEAYPSIKSGNYILWTEIYINPSESEYLKDIYGGDEGLKELYKDQNEEDILEEDLKYLRLYEKTRVSFGGRSYIKNFYFGEVEEPITILPGDDS